MCNSLWAQNFLLSQKKKKKVYWILQIAILEKTHRFIVFPRKMKEKKLPNEYEPLFIPK